eukprot:g3208.t1
MEFAASPAGGGMFDVPPISAWLRAGLAGGRARETDKGDLHLPAPIRTRYTLCFRITGYLDNNQWLRLSCCSMGWRDLVTLRAQMGFVHEAARPWRSSAGGDDHFSGWERLGLAGRGSEWARLRDRLLLPPPAERQGLRCSADAMSLEHFFQNHEKLPGLPVIFTDLAEKWPCFANPTRRWTMKNMLRRFPDDWFRFDDLHGEEIPYLSYWAYTQVTDDDSPLAIYDSQFGEPEDHYSDSDGEDGTSEHRTAKNELVREYTVPKYFRDDMFSIVCSTDIDSVPLPGPSSDNDNRPPFRWILIGPERSGTGLHIDPLMTSAWVTLLNGTKRWFMFPPDTDYSLVGFYEHGPSKMEAVEWFMRFARAEAAQGVPGCIEILQQAGETVFVPAGWLHIVVNLTTTLSITHNYASPHSGKDGIQAIWEEIATTEPDFARRWFSALARGGTLPKWAQENNIESYVREKHLDMRRSRSVDWDL